MWICWSHNMEPKSKDLPDWKTGNKQLLQKIKISSSSKKSSYSLRKTIINDRLSKTLSYKTVTWDTRITESVKYYQTMNNIFFSFSSISSSTADPSDDAAPIWVTAFNRSFTVYETNSNVNFAYRKLTPKTFKLAQLHPWILFFMLRWHLRKEIFKYFLSILDSQQWCPSHTLCKKK